MQKIFIVLGFALLVGGLLFAMKFVSGGQSVGLKTRAAVGNSVVINDGQKTTSSLAVKLKFTATPKPTFMKVANSLLGLRNAKKQQFVTDMVWNLDEKGMRKKYVYVIFNNGENRGEASGVNPIPVWSTPVVASIDYVIETLPTYTSYVFQCMGDEVITGYVTDCQTESALKELALSTCKIEKRELVSFRVVSESRCNQPPPSLSGYRSLKYYCSNGTEGLHSDLKCLSQENLKEVAKGICAARNASLSDYSFISSSACSL